ncbi:MAG: YbhB/YbcL family Raf kinase inhibitor-like protein [Burkholderiales bacterium]
MKKVIICAVLAALLLVGCAPAKNDNQGNAETSQPPKASVESKLTEQPAGDSTAAAEHPIDTASAAAERPEIEMTVTSSGITDGVIDQKYGHSELSLPLSIEGAPEDTACFAIYMDDPDAVPVCGYRFVHWMAVNISASDIPEDFSRQAGETTVQGKNDFGKTGYGGPAPPDKDHTYEITVFALDAELSLSEGFTKEEFTAAVSGHTLSTVTLKGLYKK